MDLTDRDRRILAELEGQFTTGRRGSPAPGAAAGPARRRRRPQWTIVPSAVLGCLLFAAGVALGVGNAVLMGTFLLLWWLSPWVWRLLRRVGHNLLESFTS
jgi:hypothetical protein